MSKYLFETPKGKAVSSLFSSVQYNLFKPLFAGQSKTNAEMMDLLKNLYYGKTVEIESLCKFIKDIGLDLQSLNELIKEAFTAANKVVNDSLRSISCNSFLICTKTFHSASALISSL